MTTREDDIEYERRVVYVNRSARAKPAPIVALVRQHFRVNRHFVKHFAKTGLSIEDVAKGQVIEDFFLRPRTLFGWKRR